MDDSEEASGWPRSSASRAAVAVFPVSTGARWRASGREEEEEDDDEKRQQLRRMLCSADEGGGGGADVSLREWLDRPSRAVDLLECLHIFRQIAEAVGAAHSDGVVVGNVRPSCFVMSPLNRVSFIESASCSSSDEGAAESGREEFPEGPSSATCLEERRKAEGGEEEKGFPLKRILQMESGWYTSPEEADGDASSTFASDIYRLGVLLFELFCTFDSPEEKLTTMADLRHRVLPPQLLLKWPKEASFCLWLLHPQPDTRPKMRSLWSILA